MQKQSNKISLKTILVGIQPVNWVLIVLMIFFSIASPTFFSIENALSLSRQGALLMILCMGVIVIKITGGMDLSNGATMTLGGMIMAWAMVNLNIPLPLASLLALLTTVFFGFLNGFFVSVLRIPSFISTLGTQGIAVGLALGMNNGNVIGNLPKEIGVIGNNDFIGLPIPLWITILTFIFTFILLNHTKFGVYIYAIGGNEEALKLSGKSVVLYKILAYAYSGFMAGIAALILTSRNMAAQPTVGLGMEFQAFAGVVLGGSFMAGRGTALGAALGAIVIIVLRNGLNLIGIPTYLQLAIFGSILISAIVLSTLMEQNAQKWLEE
jgi:ribose transport system permease protein